ncbi:glycosyltransferase [Streptomyces anulatus]
MFWRLLSFHCVVPCFNEAAVIETFYSAVDDVLGPITFDYEICYVDDGSTDRAWDINGGLSLSDRRVRYAALSRNFGRRPRYSWASGCLADGQQSSWMWRCWTVSATSDCCHARQWTRCCRCPRRSAARQDARERHGNSRPSWRSGSSTPLFT